MDPQQLAAAGEAVAKADALIVAAGAGMGVDSGLPDFRGDEGFWRAYPPYARLGMSFVELANPAGFFRDPELAWGFYGHRRALYRETTPHRGFAILRRWIERLPVGGFTVTSNVDGQFQAAGFDPDALYEVHGTIHRDQCLAACGGPPWEPDDHVAVDEPTIRRFSEMLVRRYGAALVRINPREPEVPPGQVGIAGGAVEVLTAVDAMLVS